MHQNRSHHHHGTAEGSFTAKKWFGHRAGRSPCAHSIGKFFLCYIVLFSSETSAPGSPGNYLYDNLDIVIIQHPSISGTLMIHHLLPFDLAKTHGEGKLTDLCSQTAWTTCASWVENPKMERVVLTIRFFDGIRDKTSSDWMGQFASVCLFQFINLCVMMHFYCDILLNVYLNKYA